MGDLLPCPFCGGEAGKLTDATRLLGSWNLIHRCPVIGPIKIERSTREEVVAIWNRRAPAWQLIATAPMDGTTLLLADNRVGGGHIVAAAWDEEAGLWASAELISFPPGFFTHWAGPITPPAPQQEADR